VTAADVSRKKTKRTKEEEAFVKNKRVTHIRAKEQTEIEHIYDTEKNEIEGIMHACTERFNK